MNTGTTTRRHGDTVTRGNTKKLSPRLRVSASPRQALLTFILLTWAICATHAISDNAGTSNGAFLKIATDARGVALGPTIVSMVEGSDGMRWNPAALGMTETQEVSATHILYYQDVSIENVNYAYPLEDSALGASLFYLSPGTLEGRDATGVRTGDFDFYDLVGSVGYGRRLPMSDTHFPIYLGGALKLVQERIADTQELNPALDAGLIALPMDNLRVGFTLRNLSVGKADFPKELIGGASLTLYRDFTGGFAVTYADDAPIRFGLGAECRFPQLEGSVIRAGYRSHDSLDDSLDSDISAFRNASWAGVTLGAGLEYRPPVFKTLFFQFDYGMAPFGALGISHTITVKAKW